LFFFLGVENRWGSSTYDDLICEKDHRRSLF